MFGKTELLGCAIALISIVAMYTDLRRGVIPNALTLPAIAIGLVFSGAMGGWAGMLDAGAGMGIGLAVMGSLFYLEIVGGGDVKLLMAFGAWGGAPFSWNIAMGSILIGGLMAIGRLALQGRLREFAARMALQRFARTSLVSTHDQMPYGVALSLAAGFEVLRLGGVLPW